MSRLEELKLAFAAHVTESVVEADGNFHYDERKLFALLFPRLLLVEFGFIDERGQTTDHFSSTRDEALLSLPGQLSLDEKLELLALFWGASVADDDLAAEELQVIRHAARLLKIPDAQVDETLDRLERDRKAGIS